MKKYLAFALVVLLISFGVYFGVNVGKNLTRETADQQGTDQIPESNVNVTDLSNTGLTAVTSSIYTKTDTTDLLLSFNSIKSLPNEMGKMTNIVVLRIDHNLLEGSLIGEVRQMSQLRTLDVSYNNMTGMPAEIGQLHKLETLNYSYNKLTGLPNEIANLKNNLRELILTGNPLSQAEITKLKADLPDTSVIF